MLPQVNAATDSAPDMTVTADASSEGNYSATQSSVASKMPTARIDEAQSVSVVTQQQLDDYQASSLADAMRFVSGVTEANTLAGTEDGFVRRGFGSNADGSIYRDGIRSSQGLNFDATTERVEVLKGSSSLLYGIQNPGGIINVVSKKTAIQLALQRQRTLRQ
ncbi:Ferric hydroxamate uptake [Pantoea agglomerans]|uniref:Ferric hydroxamate uptake n=1 Tax=Enterobacter agglomerans TaxID=549 RepID=A0A379LU56_ENTAG|nr:Ferric hydroxamate uptake [Pantoea agglomerans]